MEHKTRLILPAEAAERLHVGKKQITLMILRGELRGFKVSTVAGWRVDEESLEEYIQNGFARAAKPEQEDSTQ